MHNGFTLLAAVPLPARFPQTLTAAGHPDDAVREALTVCTDDAMIESYLVEYEKRRKDYMGMPLDAAGDDDDAAHAAVPAGGV